MERTTQTMLVSMTLLPCLILAAACGEEPTPVPPSATASAPEVGTATPSPSPLPTVTPESPATVDRRAVDLGLPAGDCFQVQASDPARDRVYALCAHTDGGAADAVVALDGSSGERLALVHLGGARAADGGHLALDLEVDRLCALSRDLGTLVILDADTPARAGRLRGGSGCTPGTGTVPVCGRLRATLEGHAEIEGNVFVAFDPGGNLLAVAADDGMVRLWDVANCAGEGATCGRLMQLLERHTMSVESLAFAPEDGLLLSGGQDNSLQLWDVRVCANGAEGCGRLLHTLEGPGTIDSLAFRPDGKVVASAEGWPSGDRLVLWGVVGE